MGFKNASKQIEYEDGQFRQQVSIRIEEGEETRDTRNRHDSTPPNRRDVTDIKEEIDEGYDDDEEYDDEADLIARDLDDDRDELARSQEDGWPYADDDRESSEYG